MQKNRTDSTILQSEHRQLISEFKENMSGQVTFHTSERSSYRDGMFAEEWVTEKLFGHDVAPIVPNHWKSE